MVKQLTVKWCRELNVHKLLFSASVANVVSSTLSSRSYHLPTSHFLCLLFQLLKSFGQVQFYFEAGGTCPRQIASRFKSWLSILMWFLRSPNAPKSKFSGALPRTPLEELTVLPHARSWWGGGSLPLTKNPTPPPALGPSGLVSMGLMV